MVLPDTTPSIRESLHRLEDQPDDSRAWSHVFGRYHPHLVDLLRQRGVSHALAEELAQDVLVRFFRRIRVFRCDKTKKFHGYLSTAAQNALVDAHRRQARRVAVATGNTELQELLKRVPDKHTTEEIASEWADDVHKQVVSRAMAQVRKRSSRQTWQAFELRLEERTAKEVATELGMSVTAVFQAWSRTFRRIHDAATEILRLEAEIAPATSD